MFPVHFNENSPQSYTSIRMYFRQPDRTHLSLLRRGTELTDLGQIGAASIRFQTLPPLTPVEQTQTKGTMNKTGIEERDFGVAEDQ